MIIGITVTVVCCGNKEIKDSYKIITVDIFCDFSCMHITYESVTEEHKSRK